MVVSGARDEFGSNSASPAPTKANGDAETGLPGELVFQQQGQSEGEYRCQHQEHGGINGSGPEKSFRV